MCLAVSGVSSADDTVHVLETTERFGGYSWSLLPRCQGPLHDALGRWHRRGGRYAENVDEFVKKLDELRRGSVKPFFDDADVMPWEERLELALQNLHNIDIPEEMTVCDSIPDTVSCGPMEEHQEACVLEASPDSVKDIVQNVQFPQVFALGARTLDVSSSEECEEHVMEFESVAAAVDTSSDEESLSEINGSESPPHLVSKMDLYPTSVLELEMFRRLYRSVSCLL